MEKRDLLLIAALVLTFLLVYSPHFSYQYPLHVDEWYHIENSKNLLSSPKAYFENFNPIEAGFQIILAVLDVFLPLVLIYKFLPAINALIISIILFYFLSKKKNFWVGLIAVIFFASLKSNVNVLGLWFFVPVTAAIVFDYCCLFTLENKDPKKIYLTALFLFLIAFIHPSSFLMIGLVVLIFFLFNHKFVKNNYKHFLWFLILIIPFFIVFYKMTHGLTQINLFFNQFTWGPNIIQINFNPFLFYGILLSIFALLGYYKTHKDKELLAFRIYILIPLINLLLFPIAGFTLFSSYQRSLYHFMIAAVPLSAIGFYYFIRLANFAFRNFKKHTRYILIGAILLLSFFLIFHSYYKIHPQTKLYYAIDDDDYGAMLFLKDLGESTNRTYPVYFDSGEVLANRYPSTAMLAVTQKYPLTRIFGAIKEYDGKIHAFFTGNCSGKEEVINYFPKLEYVYSYEQINCTFLDELFRNDKVYIYEINLSLLQSNK